MILNGKLIELIHAELALQQFVHNDLSFYVARLVLLETCTTCLTQTARHFYIVSPTRKYFPNSRNSTIFHNLCTVAKSYQHATYFTLYTVPPTQCHRMTGLTGTPTLIKCELSYLHTYTLIHPINNQHTNTRLQ